MDEKQNRARAFSAFGYAARVAVLVILTEALIMVLLGYLQVSRVASGAIDTSLLTLSSSLHIRVGLPPPFKEVALRREAGLKLEEANAQIEDTPAPRGEDR